jgi:hypothetical protein
MKAMILLVLFGCWMLNTPILAAQKEVAVLSKSSLP